ncbi:hypothetical protein Hanom_Chr05g00458251 [Helianthus anomalus]
MGVSDRVADLLGPRLRAAMDCRWPQHTELTLEFHCTFRHKEGTFAEKNAVSFSLGRNLYEMSIAEFGVALGFYTERERNWNLASFFAWSCNRPRRWGNRAAMDLGPYITRLATNLGALTKYKLEQMRENLPTTYWSVGDLQLVGILSYSDPSEWEFRQGAQVQSPAGTKAANILQGVFPPRQHRPQQRHEIPAPQHPLRQARQPRPDPFTHEAAYDLTQQRFDQLEDRMRVDHQRMMQSHHRQDDMLRYMMPGMRLDVPPPFSGLLPPPVYGGEQQAPYVFGHMDGSRQEVQECSRWMRGKATSDGDGLKRHISFYDYFILCCFSSSIGLYYRFPFVREREFLYCLLSTFGIGGHLWNRDWHIDSLIFFELSLFHCRVVSSFVR